MSQHYFAHISPGLEPLLKEELKSLGARKIKLEEGGAHFQGTRKHLYRVLQWSRLANRIYWTLIEGTAPNTNALFERVTKIAWPEIFSPSSKPLKVAIRVSLSHHVELQGTGQAESIILRAIERSLEGSRVVKSAHWSDPDSETARVLVRLHEHRVSVRLDACGQLLHRRGWRQNEGQAPLRPTLAMAMLKLLEWSPDEPLLDPMCGSGTIAIEAARFASQRRPRVWEDYSCKTWRSFDEELWSSERDSLSADHEAARYHSHIQASDLSSEAITHTQAHLSRAQEMVQVRVLDVKELTPITPQVNPATAPPNDHKRSRGLILFNPPYGLRVKEVDETKALLRLFSSDPERWRGWRLGFIYPRQLTPPATSGLVARELARFQHGGLPVWVWRYEHL